MIEKTKLLKTEAKNRNKIFDDTFNSPELKGILKQSRKDLRVVELFAGAGGMGLGFLMASNSEYGYKIIHSAEIDRIYLNSLEKNYKYYENNFKNRLDNCIPSNFTPCDLTENSSRYELQKKVKQAGGVDIVIGGTPCQGFSSSNRGGWNAKKHHNKLVEYFIELALELSPKIILLENVQGILWTSRSNRKTKNKLSVVGHFAKKLIKAGYFLFPTFIQN